MIVLSLFHIWNFFIFESFNVIFTILIVYWVIKVQLSCEHDAPFQ